MKSKLLFGALILSSITHAQLPNYVPTNGLVGYWPFTGNTNDLSGNGNNGVVNGATLTADALATPNNAYHFDGNTQFIEVPNSPSLVFGTNQISLSFWIKVESFPPSFSDIIISKQSGSGSSQSGFNIAQANQTSLGLLVSAGGSNFGGTPPIPSNSTNFNIFHHAVVIYDNGVGTSYLDGVLIGTSSIQTATIGTNTLPLLFGKANWSNINATPFNGILDDIGIWNRALTNCEVTELYNRQIQSNSISDIQSACNSYSWIDGNTYTSSNNTATHLLTNQYGCDSLITLDLTINYPTSGTDIQTTCDSYLWIDGNTYTASTNTPTWTLTNAAGCDSIVTLDLTLNSSSSSTLNETALDSYTLNGQTYTQTGIYTQIIPNAANCDSTITLNLTMNYTGLEENGNAKIQIYPNPFTNELTIISSYLGEIKITNLLGVLVIVQNKESEKLTLSNIILNPGTYFLQQGNTVIKLIKQ